VARKKVWPLRISYQTALSKVLGSSPLAYCTPDEGRQSGVRARVAYHGFLSL
jgi:hypothetical protein